MTSIIMDAPMASGVAEAVPVWKKVDWSPEIEQGIYRDWGSYYSRRRRENLGMYYFDKAMQLAPKDYVTLWLRSQSRRRNALPRLALSDSLEAQKILKNLNQDNALVNLEVCDALYELNEFAKSKAELHNNARLFTGNKSKIFERRLGVVDDTINDACGPAMTEFLRENEAICQFVREKEKKDLKAAVDVRPLWKILKEQEKCDVLSIPEMDEELLSPLEVARRARAFDVFNQMFLDRSWVDVVFLRHIRKDPGLLLDQCKNSSEFLRTTTNKKYSEVKTFLKMLEARSPMFYVRHKKFTNPQLMEKFRQDYLYRVQYQTRRNMNSVLRSIKFLRKTNNVAKLASYVEEVMGDYVVKKTNRTMPWKFEFLNEVYNTLALAHMDQLWVPKNFRFQQKNALLSLLHFPMDKGLDVPTFVFGDRKTHQSSDLSDPVLAKSRKAISRYEKRLVFAKYSIEKAYLMHQIGVAHLQSNRFDECCFAARKGIQEAELCNNNVWRFLCVLLIIKANAALHKIERTRESLDSAIKIAERLGSGQLMKYLYSCVNCNEEEFVVKKQSMSASASRRDSKVSTHSFGSEVASARKSAIPRE
ncbi:hypothetical protein KR026_006185 [Drosophila bipectinata]|nr:hypothetical protein KR026_006185 [Drosophila bipectinata]